jgi:ribosomal protein S5
MSVFVYKDGSESLIPPEQLQEHLINGWSVTEGTKAPTKEESDTNGTGLLSNKEVRAAAEKAGITDFDTKRIKPLKVELGYEASK